MVSISSFQKRSADVRVVLGTDPGTGDEVAVQITYDPTTINAANDAEFQREQNDPKAISRRIATTFRHWDLEGPLVVDVPMSDENGKTLYDDNGAIRFVSQIIVPEGQKIPLSPNVIQYLNHNATLAMWRAVVEDAIPNAKTSDA